MFLYGVLYSHFLYILCGCIGSVTTMPHGDEICNEPVQHLALARRELYRHLLYNM